MFVEVGVVVGSQKDPWAICVSESELREIEGSRDPDDPYSEGRCEPHFVIRHLGKWPPGTTIQAFTEQLKQIHAMAFRRSRRNWITTRVDVTGRGPSVADSFKHHIEDCWPTSVYFNHGDKRMPVERSQMHLGKAYLVGRLQVLLQGRRLHLPRTAETNVLAEELLAYEIEMDPDASSREGAFKVGTRDELVTALGLAILDDPVEVGISVIYV